MGEWSDILLKVGSFCGQHKQGGLFQRPVTYVLFLLVIRINWQERQPQGELSSDCGTCLPSSTLLLKWKEFREDFPSLALRSCHGGAVCC